MQRLHPTLHRRLARTTAALAVVVGAAVPVAHAAASETPPEPSTTARGAGSPTTVAQSARHPPLHVLATRTPGVFALPGFRDSPLDMSDLEAAITEISRSAVKPHMVDSSGDATIVVGFEDLPYPRVGETKTCTITNEAGLCTRVFVVVDRIRPRDQLGRVLALTHELGHAIGLDHNDDTTSLMFRKRLPQSTPTLNADDLAEISRIYP